MKTKLLSLFAVATAAFVLTFSATVPAAPAPKAVPATSANPAAPVPAEPHPEIRAALEALRKAKFRMEHADHDFGGHRAEAIKATDEAIRQLQLCLQFDR